MNDYCRKHRQDYVAACLDCMGEKQAAYEASQPCSCATCPVHKRADGWQPMRVPAERDTASMRAELLISEPKLR